MVARFLPIAERAWDFHVACSVG